MSDFIAVTVFIIGLCLLLTVPVVLLSGWIESTSCHAKYENYDPEWGWFSGCRVEWNGKLTPVDIIREI